MKKIIFALLFSLVVKSHATDLNLEHKNYVAPSLFQISDENAPRDKWGGAGFNKVKYMKSGAAKIMVIDKVNRGEGWGTGVVLPEGKILTCYHVIEGTNTIVSVLRWQDNDFLPAKVVAFDSERDIAILQIESKAFTYHFLQRKFHEGEKIFMVGDPLGIDFDVAKSHITAISKELHPHYAMTQFIYPCDRMAPGYSGGPVYNQLGEVIGLNEFSYGRSMMDILLNRDTIEYCGAIPIREVLDRFPELEK